MPPGHLKKKREEKMAEEGVPAMTTVEEPPSEVSPFNFCNYETFSNPENSNASNVLC